MLNSEYDNMKSFIKNLNMEYKNAIERFKTLESQIKNNKPIGYKDRWCQYQTEVTKNAFPGILISLGINCSYSTYSKSFPL